MNFAHSKKIIYASTAVVLFVLLCVAYSYFIEPQRLVVNEQRLEIKDWDRAFDGLKVVAVSDIHGGSNGGDAEKIREIVKKINEQNADVVALLGDYVSQDKNAPSGLKMPMAEVADNLAGIKAKYGVFAVLGNHDGFYSDDIVAKELTRVGYTVLQNEIVPIKRNGGTLRILGLKDHMKLDFWRSFKTEMQETIERYQQDGGLLILEHSPDTLVAIHFGNAFGDQYRLMLAGHTHGGQIRFPILGSPIVPSSYGQKYAAGHVKDYGRDMFVTTGTGTSILPLRFLMPPEIAVLTIVNSES